ncbi:ArsR family transcriptional regulator [Oenococcus oeni S25]|uniref:Winged helix-turn-helix transcriptional regulator n=4 Tax=Oenococcus oeni TaxID=1247 RepID=A0A483BY99_OENOE|nr:winged helix-turn-helix transcriptional regulator [Oenococcus oeni]KGO16351.1 ArsR family transcriptional regulator [Oenococcus oeni X2L]KGH56795.1 ArsR family transcriptional regulator [Oenococcus oeni S22]KGH71037.1 ArsR family transcriptional regulator [Oenococcus oeni S25]KGH80602.1 ArsR family transcriptional regulator [Oenococcus oeni IOEB_0607]KGH90714.1 ArsR family transcriptional regulator [Oenococcus oeni IOEB_L26_1]
MNDKQYQEIASLLERLSRNNAMSIYGNWIKNSFSKELIASVSVLTHNDLKILDSLFKQDLSISDVVSRTGLSQGGVSRRVNMMSKKGIIHKYQNDKNKKTVFLKLNPIGQELVDFHRKLHDHIKEIFFQKTQRFNEEQIRVVISFLEAILAK